MGFFGGDEGSVIKNVASYFVGGVIWENVGPDNVVIMNGDGLGGKLTQLNLASPDVDRPWGHKSVLGGRVSPSSGRFLVSLGTRPSVE